MNLKQAKVISLVAKDFEDLEFWYPTLRLREEGAEVHVVGEVAEHTYLGKYGVPATTTHSFHSLSSEEYDILLVPGGWAPDKLRRYPDVIRVVREMNAADKVIGQICHAGWVLASAGVLRGKRVTSTPGIKDDLTNAGATWVDEAVVVDGNIVSSRRPPDLPAYLSALIEVAESR
jgi:protease I